MSLATVCSKVRLQASSFFLHSAATASRLLYLLSLPATHYVFCRLARPKNSHRHNFLLGYFICSAINMPPKQTAAKTMVKSTKLTQGEKKKLKNDNKAKANPEKAAAKKEKNDNKRERRYVHTLLSWTVAAVSILLKYMTQRLNLLF